MSIPATMRVVEITTPGPPENMQIGERPVPTPLAGEVLVKVAAAGVNRADILQRLGNYPPPPGASDVLGLEVSGTVAGLGDGLFAVLRFAGRPGDMGFGNPFNRF